MLTCFAVQVAVEDIIADGKLRLAVQPVFDETQLAAALQVQTIYNIYSQIPLFVDCLDS